MATQRQNTLYAKNNIVLTIAIDKYEHYPRLALKDRVKNAQRLKKTLVKNFKNFSDNDCYSIENQQATKENILKWLKKLVAEGSSTTNLIIYFSGHSSFQNGELHWIPSDVKSKHRYGMIAFSDIIALFKESLIHHLLIISDTCYAGSTFHQQLNFTEKDELSLDKATSRWALTLSTEMTQFDSGEMVDSFTPALCDTLDERSQKEKYLSLSELHSKLNNRFKSDTTATIYPLTINNLDENSGQIVFSSKYAPYIDETTPVVVHRSPLAKVKWDDSHKAIYVSENQYIIPKKTFFNNKYAITTYILILIGLCRWAYMYNRDALKPKNIVQVIIPTHFMSDTTAPQPDYDGLRENINKDGAPTYVAVPTPANEHLRDLLKAYEAQNWDDWRPPTTQNVPSTPNSTNASAPNKNAVTPQYLNLVLAGSFENIEYAQALVSRLKKIGFKKSEIVMKDQSPNMIVITDFNLSKKEAQLELNALRKKGISVYYTKKNVDEIYRNEKPQ